VGKLYSEMSKAVEIADVKSALAREGLELAVEGPRSLADRLRSETVKWQNIVRQIGDVVLD
jgi:tripartite-type tricarboxylate transporter receptor subunit TctC